MTTQQVLLAAATLSLGLSGWLLLPRGQQPGRTIGIALGVVCLVLFGAQLPLLATWISDALFGTLALVTLVAATVMITARDPRQSALAFVFVLLGTWGLFLLLGAYLLALAALVIYAGLIGGLYWYWARHAHASEPAEYDLVSWEPALAAASGAVLVGMLTMLIMTATGDPETLVSWGMDQVSPTETPLAQPRQESGLLLQHSITLAVAGLLLLTALAGGAAAHASRRMTSVSLPTPAAETESDADGGS